MATGPRLLAPVRRSRRSPVLGDRRVLALRILARFGVLAAVVSAAAVITALV